MSNSDVYLLIQKVKDLEKRVVELETKLEKITDFKNLVKDHVNTLVASGGNVK